MVGDEKGEKLNDNPQLLIWEQLMETGSPKGGRKLWKCGKEEKKVGISFEKLSLMVSKVPYGAKIKIWESVAYRCYLQL
jgi:hypothetical protein